MFKQMTGIPSIKMTLKTLCVIGFLLMSSLGLHAEDLYDKEYIIGSEDVLEIQVWDNEDLERTVEVSREGAFTFPLIGKIHADGLSVFKLESLIKKRLADDYIVAPQVTINVKEYKTQKVYILGQVRSPGVYVIKNRRSHILELISKAGGATNMAGRTITIVRSKSGKQSGDAISLAGDEENEIITLDLGGFKEDSGFDDFFVKSGDYIYVDKISRVFVTGQVVKPGEFEWEKGLTVRQAISLAGGITRLAAAKRTVVIRIKDNGKEKKLKVYMDDLVKPDDIIKVPERYF